MKCIGFVSTKEVARIRNAEAFAEVQAGRAIYITKKHYRAVRGRQ